mmetsp:Transcript_15706/g.28485  ORF Transcript_15706/g.28485 Transcript_15706/m.28485 type:complete len:89 (+) Transcript_15706:354-620(+)
MSCFAGNVVGIIATRALTPMFVKDVEMHTARLFSGTGRAAWSLKSVKVAAMNFVKTAIRLVITASEIDVMIAPPRSNAKIQHARKQTV